MRTLSLTLVAAALCIAETSPTLAQVVFRSRAGNTAGAQGQGPKVGERKFADKPLARIWYSKLNVRKGLGYMQQVAEEMEIKRSQIMMLPPGGQVAGSIGMGDPKKDQELKGMLVYMTKGLIPGIETFQFQSVKDEAEFRKFVLQRKGMFGQDAKLIGSGDRYEVQVNFQQMLAGADLPDTAKGDDEPGGSRVAIKFSFSTSPSDAGDADKPTGTAQPAPEFTMGSMSTYYRYHDGVMFESQAPELHDLKLPKREDLTLRKAQNALDIYADINLSQIPIAYKEIFFNAIKVKANAFLQQHDEEPDEEYRLRKSTGDFSLELTRAAIMDLDRIRLSLSFAQGENKPLKADLVVDARKNSNLAKQLGQVSRGVSRFDALRRVESPMTVASAWQMPENVRTVLKAMFENGKIRMQEQLAADADGLLAVEDMFTILSETIDDGAADAIVKLGGDAKSGFALYGGMRIKGAEQLAKHLSTALNGLPATPDNEIRVTREDDREFLSFRLDELYVPGIDANEKVPGQLHFTVAESCLWFSVGGTTSFDVLKSCLTDLEGQKNRPAPAAPFVLDLKLSDWLKSEDAAAQNQFSEVPMETLQRFEQALHRSLADQFSFSFQMPGLGEPSGPDMGFRDSYLAKALKPGYDDLHLEVDTSPKTVRAKLRVGEGVIKFFVARLVDVQNRAMENVNIQIMDGGGDGKSRTIRVGGPGQ